MISIENLSVRYRDEFALEQVTAQIQKGELLAVVGPNGAGKSTLLKTIMDQIKPHTGHIDLAQSRLSDIAYLPQSSQIDKQFPITVREFVAGGAWRRLSFWRAFNRKENVRIYSALETVGLLGMEERQISALSGGQFQRMLFARMLVQDADILLLDEPFNAIDAQTIEDLMKVIERCQQAGKTVIAVIHDLALVQRYFPQVMLLATQMIAKGDAHQVLSTDNLIRAGYQHLAHLPADSTLLSKTA
ncbi:ABC transporter ATP-binding protein [Photobacterium jeanii]|uniref:ABC transporter ATP-binding protein n=1 Tax=Photobacterium jeanii TaxID=858640 RepID=A0A178K293_9GAMM|nr:metal ABC transporter ATP-binding protein [Photobacterium jeanii]OAN11227.1 ABC transporter ATP-binding protein [Photobacterium jeanii]PST90746.1 metal ABC transporter ATP-binding protein [Photobacterium jeanii]